MYILDVFSHFNDFYTKEALMSGDVDKFTLSFDILYGVVTDVLKRLKVLIHLNDAISYLWQKLV